MSFKLCAAVWDQELPYLQKLLLMALADHADDETCECWPTHGHLAKKCGMGTATVKRCIKKLEKAGLLEVRSMTNNGYQVANVYTLKIGTTGVDQSDLPGRSASTPRGDQSDLPINKPINKNLSSNTPQTPRKRCKADPFPRPPEVDPERWDAFMAIRKRRKSVNSAMAYRLLMNKIRKAKDLGLDIAELFDAAIEGSWQTIYPKPNKHTAKRQALPEV